MTYTSPGNGLGVMNASDNTTTSLKIQQWMEATVNLSLEAMDHNITNFVEIGVKSNRISSQIGISSRFKI